MMTRKRAPAPPDRLPRREFVLRAGGVAASLLGAAGSVPSVVYGISQSTPPVRVALLGLEAGKATPGNSDEVSAALRGAELGAAEASQAARLLGREFERVLFLNVGARGDALRAACYPGTFHVVPSESMQRDAVELWQATVRSEAGEPAAWVSWGVWKEVGGHPVDDGGFDESVSAVIGRTRFMAVSGVIVGCFSALVILGQWIPTLVLSPCQGIS
jgi:hypothetical protein